MPFKKTFIRAFQFQYFVKLVSTSCLTKLICLLTSNLPYKSCNILIVISWGWHIILSVEAAAISIELRRIPIHDTLQGRLCYLGLLPRLSSISKGKPPLSPPHHFQRCFVEFLDMNETRNTSETSYMPVTHSFPQKPVLCLTGDKDKLVKALARTLLSCDPVQPVIGMASGYIQRVFQTSTLQNHAWE